MLEQLHHGCMPQEHLWREIKDSMPLINKPVGGLWTSTLLPDGTSDWLRWCENNEFKKSGELWVLTPARDARIYTIHTVKDIAIICKGFSNGLFASLDFVELKEHYDAIHLTKLGEKETRFSRPYSLYGWDCESTVWLNWKFDSVRPLAIANAAG